MTRCAQFYEKLEKDGNFCGMRDKDYKEAVDFWKTVKKDKSGKPELTCGAWFKQKRELSAEEDTKKTDKLYKKKRLNNADFAKGVEDFWIWARKYRTEKVIEEVLDKARVNTR